MEVEIISAELTGNSGLTVLYRVMGDVVTREMIKALPTSKTDILAAIKLEYELRKAGSKVIQELVGKFKL